jgi:phosphomannomutase/carbonic anhydrase/acetyltransferase-like protein (isoleucine patch superfamily)
VKTWDEHLSDAPASLRAPTAAEIATLRAHGNRGDLHALRFGPVWSAQALEDIEDTTFSGACWLLGPRAELRGAQIRLAILASCVVRTSHVSRSFLGDGVTVEHHAFVEDATLLAFARRTPTGEHLFPVRVHASYVTQSVVWGGSDIGPYANVRSHSVVGPFAHVGTGTEIKASCALGATPRNRIELPHRSYFGNACAKALCLDPDFGAEAYFTEIESKLSALYGAELVALSCDEDVDGAVQPREHLRLRANGRLVSVDVEGVNLGALTTTSNFDPRHGGVKLPTNVEAGARFGVLAIAQSPVQVAPGVLVASGAKIKGGNVPRGSLVLPGDSAEGRVLPGYLEETRGRLGDDVAETIAFTRGYLRQLVSLARGFADCGRRADALSRFASSRTVSAIAAQASELLAWFERYLGLVRRSAELLASDVDAVLDPERKARVKARAREQARSSKVADIQIAEARSFLEAARAEERSLREVADLARIVVEHRMAVGVRALESAARWRAFPGATPHEEAAARDKARAETSAQGAPRLFGTSGLRGLFGPLAGERPTRVFAQQGLITPALARLTGRALARVLGGHGVEARVQIARDVRQSGNVLVAAIESGFEDEGWSALRVGVATTPAAAALGEGLAVVVTASHNPPSDNGIKVFLDGIPLSRALELETEREMRFLEELACDARWPAPLSAEDDTTARAVAAFEGDPSARQRAMLRELAISLGLDGALAGHLLPIDLAHGAAAIDAGEHVAALSAPISHWLDEGVVVVAYGATRDPARINDRLGAAYVYGEARALVGDTLADVRPAPTELIAFARGAAGYGEGRVPGRTEPAGPPASRSVFWPSRLTLPDALAHAGVVIGGHRAFLDIDAPGAAQIRAALEPLLRELPRLPALSVDGDADRTVITDERIAARAVPFLSGDDLLRLFSALHVGALRRVVFTVESGIGLERFLEARGVPFDVVTVGDRAVAECLLARARTSGEGWLLGGEPSGHLLLAHVADTGAGKGAREHVTLTDDPFAVHLHAVALVRREGRALGALLEGLDAEFVDPPTARKPDAWARDPTRGLTGLSLVEKSALRLFGPDGRLSAYATRLCADYPRRFGEAWAELFGASGAVVAWHPSPTLSELRASASQLGPGKEEARIGEVVIVTGEGASATQESLEVTLQLTALDYFGPDDIVLRFYAPAAKGGAAKVGELVARNSGTSAKNVAYHKIWPAHPQSDRRPVDGLLAAVLARLAEARVELTERFVRETLRGSAT